MKHLFLKKLCAVIIVLFALTAVFSGCDTKSKILFDKNSPEIVQAVDVINAESD